MAQRSAWETAGNLFMGVDTGKLKEAAIIEAIGLLDEIAAMLTATQKNAEKKAVGSKGRRGTPELLRRRRRRRLD